jgi:hypothetical protein
MREHRRIAVGVLAVVVSIAGLALERGSRVAAEAIPSRLTDKAFWQLVTDFSEPNGYFRSDNFLSNELAFQRVIPELQANLPQGGVYIGVGPEQNFTYLAALHPKLAFIVDIRRGNLHEQLLYKAFLELSADRADFLSRLFARPRPAGLAADAPVDKLMSAFRSSAPSDALFAQNLQAVKDRLVKQHGFALSDEDLRGLEYVYDAFFEGGPDLNYSFSSGARGGFGGFGGPFPTYGDLMTEDDGHGVQRSYLATDANFRMVSELERNNAIVPLVGDFGGPKALRSVGRYLREHAATVTAFYTSNVEMYLFQTDAWTRYYDNVGSMPVDPKSTFIRSISTRGYRSSNQPPGMRAATRLSSIADLVAAFRTGKIQGYYDVIAMSH